VRSILIDAGPLIALFAVDDKHHDHYDQLISEFSATGLRVVTTWPCIVEASYLLGIPQRFELLQWIELGGVVVYPFSPHHLADIVAWMTTYSADNNREMDLADATLYWVANETGIREIMTTDIRDFSRYRLPDGQSFEIL
jgi:hypothetical protein